MDKIKQPLNIRINSQWQIIKEKTKQASVGQFWNYVSTYDLLERYSAEGAFWKGAY